MRWTLVALATGLAAHALAHATPPSTRRKTLGFGPDLLHARFDSMNVRPLAVVDSEKDAYAVARDFLSHYHDLQAGRTYVIRPDSYTDQATGVTHVYARQIIDGIEVANAHVNLNIKGGRVLSFGDSFFVGQVEQNARAPVHPHVQYCDRLAVAVDDLRSLLQTSLASGDRNRVAYGLAGLEHLHLSSCANVPPLSLADSGEVDMDPRRPLLAFLASALPENHPELSTLQHRLQEHVSNIVMTPETHLLGEHATPGMSLSNVPGAVGDVKARIVWMQVPTEHGVKLELVHRFEVEMKHNWYETTVTTSIPHRIVSVVDWVRDSPMHVSTPREVDRLPNLGLFVPPGTNFDSVASGKRPNKARSGKKGVPRYPESKKGSYLVFPWGTNDPVEAAQRKAAKLGEPVQTEYPLSYGREVIEELGDTLASPAGWHTLPISHDPSVSEEEKKALGQSHWRTTNTTWGNNVFAQENWDPEDIEDNTWMYNERPLVHIDGTYSYPYAPEPADTPSESVEQAKSHINASVTQLFYTVNMVHDLFYRYGFTEVAGNFQQYNFERGGEEGDAIIADAQRGDGFNNAEFMSPPDGRNGRCFMFLWDTNSPYPDGDMEADIVIHELSHGLSSRLTGGPMDSGCLGWDESGGMGEGWGDLVAITVRSTSDYSDYPVGAWASNRVGGVRQFLYSKDSSVNPSTYESLDKPEFFNLHEVGQVWAEMLWLIQQRLIAKHGFSDTLFPPVPNADGSLPHNDFYRPLTFDPVSGLPNPLVPKHGNTLLLQLVLNGMKMQPCLPSFFAARDAIIQADEVLTGGENVCEIWQGFAERGLGIDATSVVETPMDRGVRKNGFDVPAECRAIEPEPEPWHLFMYQVGKWIRRLLWGVEYYH